MVTPLNVGRYSGTPPPRGSNDRLRKISGRKPIYPACDVLPLLENGQVMLWTRRRQNYVRVRLETDESGAAAIAAAAIRNGRFLGSEWCEQAPTGPAAACDAYSVVIYTWNKFSHKELAAEYYVKIAIALNGNLILMDSCHLSEDRNRT